MSARPTWDPETVRRALAAQGYTADGDLPDVGWFGDGPELADKLGELVRRGEKTATAGLLSSWEADRGGPPAAGDREVVIDWAGAPTSIIEFTEVRILRFDEVDEAFARDEGEGDLTLRWWRDAHWKYFSRECVRSDREPTEDMPVVCIRFRVLHAAP